MILTQMSVFKSTAINFLILGSFMARKKRGNASLCLSDIQVSSCPSSQVSDMFRFLWSFQSSDRLRHPKKLSPRNSSGNIKPFYFEDGSV